MLDEEWLDNIEFEGVGGHKVQGLVGIGADAVVLSAQHSSGSERVFRIPKTAAEKREARSQAFGVTVPGAFGIAMLGAPFLGPMALGAVAAAVVSYFVTIKRKPNDA